MASAPTFTSYAVAVAATTAHNYSFVATLGPADALYVTATCSGGLSLTLPNGGGTVAVGNAVIGTIIPIPSTQATFDAGGVVALKVQ